MTCNFGLLPRMKRTSVLLIFTRQHLRRWDSLVNNDAHLSSISSQSFGYELDVSSLLRRGFVDNARAGDDDLIEYKNWGGELARSHRDEMSGVGAKRRLSRWR